MFDLGSFLEQAWQERRAEQRGDRGRRRGEPVADRGGAGPRRRDHPAEGAERMRKSAKARASCRKRIKTPRTSALLIRLRPDALAAMREAAALMDVSKSNLVARSVRELLSREV